ncbi:MAG: lipase family protein [Myxococcales bacterium]|nr:lipase family protein [Myxococcales bacterium]
MERFSLSVNQGRYDPVNAYWLCRCAKLAYHDAERTTSEAGDWGLSRVDSISRRKSQCWVGSNERLIVVAFAGTNFSEIQDLLNDADARPVAGYGGKVHAGFKRAYEAVRASLLAALGEHRGGEQALWITGHSLGAAVASLAAVDLLAQGQSLEGVYTFGQPRVGDDDFVAGYQRALGDRSYRLARVTDPIPGAPIHYRDLPTRIHITSDDRLTLNYEPSKKLIDKLKNTREALPSHLIGAYLRAVEANIGDDPFSRPDEVIREHSLVDETSIARDLKAAGDELERWFGEVFGAKA